MRFDQILLDNARRLGAEVREQCPASGVIDDGDRIRGVRYSDPDGREHEVFASYVVDASGNKSRIYSAVGGTRQYSEFFRNLALFGYFDHGKRMPSPHSGNILCEAFESGWFWYIPLTDTRTSVGAVVRRELASRVQGDPEEMLKSLIDEAPIIRDYLSGATRVTEGEYGKLRVRKDYSYHQTKFWRPGLVLIGDAACFVDPVFSSGVHLATYSALLAARSINSVLDGSVSEQAAFTEFEGRYRREYGVFYEFLTSFYDMHSDEQSYFWAARKVTKDSQSELEAFVDLVGGLSSGENALAMTADVAQRFKAGSDEFARAIDAMASDKDKSMVPLFKSSVVRKAMQEGAQVQSRAILGAEFGAEPPIFENGLVPSLDGMFWRIPNS